MALAAAAVVAIEPRSPPAGSGSPALSVPANAPPTEGVTSSVPEQTKQRVADAYRKLPLSFVPNRGQADEQVRYYARGQGFGFYFTHRKAVLALSKDRRESALELRFVGANPEVSLEAGRPAEGKVTYLDGSKSTTVSTYGEIAYRDLWPGIDMVFHGRGGALKYEFLLDPGADPADIALAYAGAGGLSVAAGGSLLIKTPHGRLRDAAPRSYQRVDGRRVAVKSRFALEGKRGYGFALGRYDRARPLVIDPAIAYSTFLGGSLHFERDPDIAVDAAGAAYVTGETFSTDFPTTLGAHDVALGGERDAFVTKLNPTGTALVYSTYLGGSDLDLGTDIAVDAAGNAYVTGFTRSSDFPTTLGAHDTTLGSDDGFVTKLNASGTGLVYSTYLGGFTFDVGRGIAVDAAGAAYVTGETASGDFPTSLGAPDTTFAGSSEGYATKLDPTGSALVYSTYLGGSSFESGEGIAVDSAGSAYVTGFTFSANFPTTTGAHDLSLGGPQDAFVTKLDTAGTAFLYSTYLGGSSDGDFGGGIAVDAAGSAYVVGFTLSADFPTTTGAHDVTLGGSRDAFVTKLDSTGTTLGYSTYLGGTLDDNGQGGGIAVDSGGNAYVTGTTESTDFPTTTGAPDTTLTGFNDFFVTQLDPTGATLVFSTYHGGSSGGNGGAIALDGAGGIYVTGDTFSADFPTTTGAADTTLGAQDAFVTKFAEPPAPPQCDDGDDDDDDGKVDDDDPGCVSPDDDSEDTDSNPECSDELDNDDDEEVDENDSECSSASDNTEAPEIQTVPFSAVADARVEEDRSSSNFGSSSYLRSDDDPDVESYLRFNLTGIAGSVLGAKLRLYVNEGTGNGPAAYKTNWTGSEGSLTWNNRTARTSGAADDKGSLSSGSFVEFNVTSLVTGNGAHSFILDTSSSDGADFASRESSTVSRRPQLIVTFGVDTTDPSPPAGLGAQALSATQVKLAWSAATDNYGVTGYRIYREGAAIATIGTQTAYTDTTAVGGTTYAYEVTALDGAGNESPPSNTATVTTPLTFTAVADARVEEANKSTNFGTSSRLRTEGGSDPDIETFLRFQLSGLGGPPASAKLRLYATSDGTGNGPAAFSTTWTGSETSLTWNTRTARTSGATDDKGAIASNSFVEFNVTSLIAGDGAHSFILATTSSDGVDFSSRETSTSSRRPQLLITP